MKRIGFLLAAVLAALTLVTVGCGGDDDEAGDDATITETTETDTTETETPSEAGGALQGTVGPGFEISLATSDGEVVTQLPPGTYDLAIEDLSSEHNFHLTGPGVDISSDVAEEGTQNVSLTLTTGSYTFVCDPHTSQMNGSFEVS